MIDTFIALFGSIFLIGNYVKKKADQASENARKRRFDDFHDTVFDNDVRFSTLTYFTNNRWAVLNGISDDLEEVFGKDWRHFFSLYKLCENNLPPSPSFYGFNDIWGAAFEIYLSRLGYISTVSYKVGMLMDGASRTDPYNMPRSRECNRKTCRVIERHMQEKYGKKMILWEASYDKNILMWDHFVDLYQGKKINRPW